MDIYKFYSYKIRGFKPTGERPFRVSPKIRKVGFTLVFIFFLMAAVTGWSQEKVKGSKPGFLETSPMLEGTIRISGAWALYPMMIKWGEEFRRVCPKVRVDISAGGAGKGVADALAGLVNIGMVSRDITQEEMKQGAFYVPVVKDAVFPIISDENPVIQKGLSTKGIKKQTLIDLWIKGKDLTWGNVVGNNSKNKVHLYTRSDSCGAAETWAQYLGGKQEDLQGIGVYGDPGLAEAIRKDPLGIGYNNLNYAYDFKTGLPPKGLRIAPVDLNENGRIDDPEEDLKNKSRAIQAIATGIYPSPPTRDLYLLTKDNLRGPPKEFIRWILTEGQRYIEETGYIKITKTQVNSALKKLGY